MKSASRPRKTDNLSESAYRYLNLCATAAGAALIGILSLSQLSEAKIIYTRTHVVLSPNPNHPDLNYNLDLNHDGITDFVVDDNINQCSRFSAVWTLGETAANGNGAQGSPPEALSRGSRIGHGQHFFGGDGRMAFKDCPNHFSGNWLRATNRYLGLKFSIGRKTHYGWARLSVQEGRFSFIVTLTGYAYETTPGKAINAGQTKEAADDSTNEAGRGASVTKPILDIPQPASPGILALGAQRDPLRRKESALEGDLRSR